MKTFIIRFAGTPPNHYDAPAPQLLAAPDKEHARQKANALAARDGWRVSSVRAWQRTHQVSGDGWLTA